MGKAGRTACQSCVARACPPRDIQHDGRRKLCRETRGTAWCTDRRSVARSRRCEVAGSSRSPTRCARDTKSTGSSWCELDFSVKSELVKIPAATLHAQFLDLICHVCCNIDYDVRGTAADIENERADASDGEDAPSV
jgi:hypothetical protein